MFTLLGILLLTGGAIATFAVERDVEGVDLQLVGWILMAGGGAALVAAVIRGATVRTSGELARPPTRLRDEERRAA